MFGREIFNFKFEILLIYLFTNNSKNRKKKAIGMLRNNLNTKNFKT